MCLYVLTLTTSVIFPPAVISHLLPCDNEPSTALNPDVASLQVWNGAQPLYDALVDDRVQAPVVAEVIAAVKAHLADRGALTSSATAHGAVARDLDFPSTCHMLTVNSAPSLQAKLTSSISLAGQATPRCRWRRLCPTHKSPSPVR